MPAPMDRPALLALMRDAIFQVAPVKPAQIEESSRLRDDLGLDSVASMELLSVLDEELGLELEMEDVLGIDTVGAFITLASTRLAEAS